MAFLMCSPDAQAKKSFGLPLLALVVKCMSWKEALPAPPVTTGAELGDAPAEGLDIEFALVLVVRRFAVVALELEEEVCGHDPSPVVGSSESSGPEWGSFNSVPGSQM